MSVFNVIHHAGKASRREIAALLDLSPPTVTRFTSELLASGLVREVGTKPSGAGRRAVLLSIEEDARLAMGIDVGSRWTRLGICNLKGKVKWQQWMKTPDRDGIAEILSLAADGLKTVDKERVIGLGIGVSGLVDHNSGVVIFCPNISGWNDFNIRDAFEGGLGIPATVDASARVMALGEYWFGEGRGKRSQIFISIGHGIGAGIILDGRIFRGDHGFAGELGHVTADERVGRCSCGNYGCLENIATMPMIMGRVRERIAAGAQSPLAEAYRNMDPHNVPRELLLEAHRLRDNVLYDELAEAGKAIGVAVANMVNLFNPSLVVLGGGVIECNKILVSEVERTVRRRALYPVQRKLEIRASALGWDGPVVGAATIAFDSYFGRSHMADIMSNLDTKLAELRNSEE